MPRRTSLLYFPRMLYDGLSSSGFGVGVFWLLLHVTFETWWRFGLLRLVGLHGIWEVRKVEDEEQMEMGRGAEKLKREKEDRQDIEAMIDLLLAHNDRSTIFALL